ncbi:MAG TPA: DOMON domain-containing protein [Thermotogota bacterium]|nr:DOMON domain-containing protein [Thermotogota bacterium]
MKKLIMLFLTILLSISLFAANELINGQLDGELQKFVNRSGNFELYWKVLENDELYFAIRAKTTGWVAVGFDPSFMMKDADIKIANIVDGVVTIEDHYGNSATGHRQDDQKEIVEYAGSEQDGWTFVEWIMPLDSGNPGDKPVKIGQKNKVILAFSSSTDSLWRKHSFRETVEPVM